MADAGETELAKELGLFSALAIGAGTMIGAGIFVLPATAVDIAGPAASLAFVVAGAIAVLTALSISELGTAMPKAGGGYYYVNDALGPLFGSIAGWGNWLGLAFATSFYMLGFGDYATIYLGLPSIWVLDGSQLAAIAAGLLFIGINYYGAKETGRTQVLIVAILIGVLAVFTIVGILHVDLDNLQPLFPEDEGATSVLPAAGVIFVTYLGFAEINTVAEEMKNPGRNLPLAVIGSLLFVIALYAVVMTVIVGIEGPEQVVDFEEQAVARLGEVMMGGVGLALLTFGGLLATASSANASILASSRINFAMGRDKIVTDWINSIHPRFLTPYRSIAITGALIILFILWGNVESLAKAGSILHLIVYGLLNLALIVYRETDHPGYDPDFRVPLYPVVPALGAILSFALIFAMAPIEIVLSALFVVFGALWYVVYARKHADSVGLVGEAIAPSPDDDGDAEQAYRVVVPVSNPETQHRLLELAAASAQTHTEVDVPEIVAVNVMEVPQQTSLEQKLHFEEERVERQQALLESAREAAAGMDVSLRTRAIIGRSAANVLLSVLSEEEADMVVLGWRALHPRREFVFGSTIDPILREAPCDVALVHLEQPTIGTPIALAGAGPHAPTAARIASEFATIDDATPVLCNVQRPTDDESTDDPSERGQAQIHAVAERAGLSPEQYEARVRVAEDIQDAILTEIEGHETVCVGVSETGRLSAALVGTTARRIAQAGGRNVVMVRSETVQPRTIRQALVEWLTRS